MAKDRLLLRRLMPIVACLVMGTGCTASNDEPVTPFQYEGAHLTVAGVDADPGGLRVTTAEHLTRFAGGKLQAFAAGEPRTQSFSAFSEAVWQWEQKAPPRWIAIGEPWARRHGFPVSWAKQLQRLSVKQGRTPLLAVVEGSAEQWVRSPHGADGVMAMLSQNGWAADSLRSFDYRVGDDLVLPYLSTDALSGWSEGGRIPAPQALLFKNQEPVTMLSSGQSELLSCLRGGDLPRMSWPAADSAESAIDKTPELKKVSCKADIAANGDLKHPRLRMLLSITALSDGRSTAWQWEDRLKQQGEELIHSLQELRTDPLRLGEATRKQYSGFWTQERWREALARAEVKLDIDVRLHGGT